MKPTSIIIVMSQDQNEAQTACWTFSQGSGWQAPTLAHQATTVYMSPTLRH